MRTKSEAAIARTMAARCITAAAWAGGERRENMRKMVQAIGGAEALAVEKSIIDMCDMRDIADALGCGASTAYRLKNNGLHEFYRLYLEDLETETADFSA